MRPPNAGRYRPSYPPEMSAKMRRLHGPVPALLFGTHKEKSVMDQQRVLITGGAGFLGINLTRHLLSRGYAIASLDVEDFDYPERDRVEVIRGDIRNKVLVDRAIEGADFVGHTAAALPLYPTGGPHTTLRPVAT